MGSTSNPERQSIGGQGLPQAYVVRSQRERLREAWVQVAPSKGFEATTVDDVIEVAGVTRETFYEMFEDKQACFLEAYDAVIEVLIAHGTRALPAARGG